MKKLFLILIAGLTLVMAQDFKRAYAGDDGGDDGGIPLSKLAGKYSETFRGGTITTCFKPDFSATENCFTKGAVPLSSSFGASTGKKPRIRTETLVQRLRAVLGFLRRSQCSLMSS